MRKEEFFKQLEYLLQDIPDEEKQDALDYYRDYLAEAGSENEEQAISDFGSPERVAAIIRADLAGNLKEGGSFTEHGYEDERFRDPNYQVAKRLDLPDEKEPETGAGYQNSGYQSAPGNDTYRNGAYQNGYGNRNTYQNQGYHNNMGTKNGYNSNTYQNNKGMNGTYQNGTYQNPNENTYQNETYHNGAYQNGPGTGYQNGTQPGGQEKRRGSSKLLKAILWIILIFVAFPALLGGGGILLGIGGGVMGLVIGLVALVGSLIIAALAAGFGLITAGVRALFTVPLEGVFLSGIGFIGVGIGLLAIILIYVLFAFLFPLIWKGIKTLVGNIRGRRP